MINEFKLKWKDGLTIRLKAIFKNEKKKELSFFKILSSKLERTEMHLIERNDNKIKMEENTIKKVFHFVSTFYLKNFNHSR